VRRANTLDGECRAAYAFKDVFTCEYLPVNTGVHRFLHVNRWVTGMFKSIDQVISYNIHILYFFVSAARKKLKHVKGCMGILCKSLGI